MLTLTLLSLGLVLTGGGSATAAPGDTAYLLSRAYLTGYPTASMNPICKSTSISLRSGEYSLDLRLNGPTYFAAGRKEVLPTGSYRWTTCITPFDGTYLLDAFLSSAALSPSRYLGYQVTLRSGTYTWGSLLDPVSF